MGGWRCILHPPAFFNKNDFSYCEVHWNLRINCLVWWLNMDETVLEWMEECGGKARLTDECSQADGTMEIWQRVVIFCATAELEATAERIGRQADNLKANDSSGGGSCYRLLITNENCCRISWRAGNKSFVSLVLDCVLLAAVAVLHANVAPVLATWCPCSFECSTLSIALRERVNYFISPMF